MKCLIECENRTEAETIIQELKTIGVIAMIRAAKTTDTQSTKLQLLVEDHEYEKVAAKIRSTST